MSVSVECDAVTLRFRARTVLESVSWRIAAQEIVGLLGASGAGKTSLLRIIAGLDRCTSGSVRLQSAGGGGAVHARIGMVFQNLGLWPHLTAEEHVRCVLPRAASAEHEQRVEELLAEVQLPKAVWKQRPAQLSGGESQRLALARALAGNPGLLLLDEPLAQLDSFLRAELLALIRRIAGERRMTVIYVTHAWSEAAELCGQIAVLSGGRIEQAGAAEDVYLRPKSLAVARLTGPVVTFPCGLVAQGRIATQDSGGHAGTIIADGELLIARPQQLRVVQPAGANHWRILHCLPHGNCWSLLVQCEGQELSIPCDRRIDTAESVGLELQSAAELSAKNG